jgi:hypothetical protein
MDNSQYKKEWKKLGSIQIKMIQKDGKCTHALNDKFYYKNPYTKPENIQFFKKLVRNFTTWGSHL